VRKVEEPGAERAECVEVDRHGRQLSTGGWRVQGGYDEASKSP